VREKLSVFMTMCTITTVINGRKGHTKTSTTVLQL
jgi:hypothetical protein